jgi:hypothetical protein
VADILLWVLRVLLFVTYLKLGLKLFVAILGAITAVDSLQGSLSNSCLWNVDYSICSFKAGHLIEAQGL